MSENNDGDNVFNFEAFRKAMEDMKENSRAKSKDSEARQAKQADSLFKLLEAYNTFFTPPSPEEIDKAIGNLAESLEKAAASIREMQTPPEGDNDDKGEK